MSIFVGVARARDRAAHGRSGCVSVCAFGGYTRLFSSRSLPLVDTHHDSHLYPRPALLRHLPAHITPLLTFAPVAAAFSCSAIVTTERTTTASSFASLPSRLSLSPVSSLLVVSHAYVHCSLFALACPLETASLVTPSHPAEKLRVCDLDIRLHHLHHPRIHTTGE
jgi:hypothetical protein